jgi:hypothetical protein
MRRDDRKQWVRKVLKRSGRGLFEINAATNLKNPDSYFPVILVIVFNIKPYQIPTQTSGV